MNFQKIVNLLTMCRRAGRLVGGFDVTLEAIVKHKSKCILVASNTSEKTIKELKYRVDSQNVQGVDFLSIPLTISDVDQYIGLNVGVIATCDDGFAKAFKKLV